MPAQAAATIRKLARTRMCTYGCAEVAAQQIGRSSAAADAAADIALEEEVAFGFRQAAPNPIGLADFKGVRTAFLDHRALPAHFLGALLALHAGAPAFPVGVEEHR